MKEDIILKGIASKILATKEITFKEAAKFFKEFSLILISQQLHHKINEEVKHFIEYKTLTIVFETRTGLRTEDILIPNDMVKDFKNYKKGDEKDINYNKVYAVILLQMNIKKFEIMSITLNN